MTRWLMLAAISMGAAVATYATHVTAEQRLQLDQLDAMIAQRRAQGLPANARTDDEW